MKKRSHYHFLFIFFKEMGIIPQIVFLCLMLPLEAIAQTGNTGLNSELIEKQSQLENKLNEKIRNEILTTLPKDGFTVSSHVTLALKAPDKTKTANQESDKTKSGAPGTSDLTLGLLNAAEVIQKLETENEKLRRDAGSRIDSASEQNARIYEVTSIEINVGLSSIYGESYQKYFLTWLKKRVQTLKLNAKVDVSLIQPAEKTNPEDKGVLDNLSKIQVLIGLLAFAVAIFASALLVRNLIAKEGEEGRKLRLQMTGDKANVNPTLAASPETRKELPKEKPVSDEESSMLRALNTKLEKDLSQKIRAMIESTNLNITGLINLWLDGSEEDYLKTVAIWDAFVTIGMTDLKNSIHANLSNSQRDLIAKAIESISTKPISERVKILEGAYWDLMAFQVLGVEGIERPFGFVQKISNDKIDYLIRKESGTNRTLTFLHLSKRQQKDVLDKMNPEERQLLTKETLSIEKISQRELNESHKSIKQLITSNKDDQDTEVSLVPLWLTMLESLEPVDELVLFRKIVNDLQSGRQNLKRIWPSLAFLDEWPSIALSKFLDDVPSADLAILVRQMPEFEPMILSNVAPKTAQILQDDLKLQTQLDKSAINQALGRLNGKLRQLVSTQELSMNEIFADGEVEVRNAA